MTKRKTARVTDGAYPSERMAELGRKGAAAVDRVGGKFVSRRRPPAGELTPPAPPPVDPPAPPPDPTPAPPPAHEAPSLLARFLRRDR